MKKPEIVCSECGCLLNTINFINEMTEHWTWNGDNWECVAQGSLVYAPEESVRCPECNNVVGTGKDFGF